MPAVPRSPLAADWSRHHFPPSAWAEVVAFGIFCANAGLWLGDVADRLDRTPPLGWWPLANAAFSIAGAVWFGLRVRRRLREAQRAVAAAPGAPAETAAPGGGVR